MKFDLSSLPSGISILSADLNLWLAAVSNDTSIDVSLHAVNTPWTEYSASWKYADVGKSWTKDGGDFNVNQITTQNIGDLTPLSVNYKWSLTPYMIEKWVNNSESNIGFILKSTNENLNSYKKFISGDDTSNPSNTPLLSITYNSSSRLGLEDYWTFDSHSLNSINSYTNLATGNNVIEFNDYEFNSRNEININFTRYYNSKSRESSVFGNRWMFSGSQTLVDLYKIGVILLTEEDGTSHEFKYDSTTKRYISPPGKYLTLEKEVSNSTTTGYYVYDTDGNETYFKVQKYDEQNSNNFAQLKSFKDTYGNVTKYNHDNNDRLTDITDPSGRKIEFYYNNKGLVQSSTFENERNEYEYDSTGNLMSVKQYVDGDKFNLTKFEYDAGGNIATITDPNGRKLDFTYKEALLVKVQDPSSVSDVDNPNRPGTGYEYNLFTTRENIVTDPLGNKTVYSMDSNFIVTGVTNPLGDSVSNTFDENYNPNKVINEAGGILLVDYDENGNVIKEIDEEGNIVTHKYDSLNREISMTEGESKVTSWTYSLSHRNPKTSTNPKNETTNFEYDEFGNLIKTIAPDGSMTKISYDEKGNYIQTVTDPNGIKITEYKDGSGNVIKRIDGEGNETNFEYDRLNNLITVLDSNQNKTSYDYDGNNNLIKITFPDLSVKQYEYNGGDSITKMITETGEKTEYKYNDNNYLVEQKEPNGDVIKLIYNENNNLREKLVNGKRLSDYEYDKTGSLIKIGTDYEINYYNNGLKKDILDRNNRTSYRYDDNGLLTGLSFEVGQKTIKHDYDFSDTSELEGIKINDELVSSFNYDRPQFIKSQSNKNGTKTDFEYTGTLIDTLTINEKDGIHDFFKISYDLRGNVETVRTKNGDINYKYNKLSQLEEETLIDGTKIKYDYDVKGNRISKVTVSVDGNITTKKYGYNQSNQLIDDNGQGYQYDKNGNLIFDGKRNYIYDALNQLIEIKESNKTVFKASYNHEGKRVRTEDENGITNYFYENGNVIYETNESNVITKSYTWDSLGRPITITIGEKTYFYHHNQHNDVVAISNESGEVITQYSYDAWGNLLTETGSLTDENPYTYAGYRFDSQTNLYYLNARYYNPETANFISRDTYSGELNNNLSLNQYSYTTNNPTNVIDPNGHKGINIIITVSFMAAAINTLIVIAFGSIGAAVIQKIVAKRGAKVLAGTITKAARKVSKKAISAFNNTGRLISLINFSLDFLAGNSSLGYVIAAKGMDGWLDPKLGYKKNNKRVFG